SNILDAANEVIHNNLGRKDKSLWTENEKGDLIQFTQFDTEYEEADQIVTDISNSIRNDGHDYNEFAILYRTNAQSRVLEEKLILRNIPYKIIGGVNFYQRKEVKDILAYLKTIDNGLDDIAVKRIINIPRRGIGLTTIDRLTDYSIAHGISFYEACRRADTIPAIGRGVAKIEPFVSLIEVLKSKLHVLSYSLEDLINEILDATGYLRELEAEDTEEAKGRIENINEFINKVVTYEKNADEEPSLSGFLEEVALVADIDNLEESNNVVVLMTLHSAKGLEFPYVYLCGMEEGIFPSYMTLNSEDPTDIEEERRLCYVGITRAMQKLHLSAARQRMLRGETQFNKPSRFIREIPRYLLQQGSSKESSFQPRVPFSGSQSNQKGGTWVPPTSFTSSGSGFRSSSNGANSSITSSDKSNLFAGNPFISKGLGSSQKLGATTFDKSTPAIIEYAVGDSVEHAKFGVGIVAEMVKQDSDYMVSVDFSNSGIKKMKASFAKLKKL
ncbi:MAG TPA: 3'-5' exonuclease, partial [Lachnospiraceae bacterium]|nr:3'-5' exonuclease [Lachnospiraceae bacterium]